MQFISLWLLFDYLQQQGFNESEKDNICVVWSKGEINLLIDMNGECLEREECLEQIDRAELDRAHFLNFIALKETKNLGAN